MHQPCVGTLSPSQNTWSKCISTTKSLQISRRSITHPGHMCPHKFSWTSFATNRSHHVWIGHVREPYITGRMFQMHLSTIQHWFTSLARQGLRHMVGTLHIGVSPLLFELDILDVLQFGKSLGLIEKSSL